MFNKLKKLFHFAEKTYTGTLGDGVSYEKQKQNEYKAVLLEEAIENIAKSYNYKVVRNLYIPVGDTYTEIDAVLIGVNGIYIIEAKNYNAMIKGSVTDRQWTAIYPNGQKYTLYNPIKQNESHANALYYNLRIKGTPLVVFSDSAKLQLRERNVQDITVLSYLGAVITKGQSKLTSKEVDALYRVLVKYKTSNPFKKMKQKRNAVQRRKRN